MKILVANLILLILWVFSGSDALPLLLQRIKRQDQEQHQPPLTNVDVLRPVGAADPAGQVTQNRPDWPFAHTFSNGLDVLPKPAVSTGGHLDIRDVKKLGSVWDMKGNLTGGSNHVWYNYGHLIQPVNRYNMSPSEFAAWRGSQQFRDARGNGTLVPVAQLPGGWSPVYCKPPLCNPFVQTVAAGVDVMPASGGFVQGGLDIPSPDGIAPRMPLDGQLFAGRQPINVQYGQMMSPVNPFNSYERGKGSSGTSGKSSGQQPPPNAQTVQRRPAMVPAAAQQQQPNGQPNSEIAPGMALPPGYSLTSSS